MGIFEETPTKGQILAQFWENADKSLIFSSHMSIFFVLFFILCYNYQTIDIFRSRFRQKSYINFKNSKTVSKISLKIVVISEGQPYHFFIINCWKNILLTILIKLMISPSILKYYSPTKNEPLFVDQL